MDGAVQPRFREHWRRVFQRKQAGARSGLFVWPTWAALLARDPPNLTIAASHRSAHSAKRPFTGMRRRNGARFL
jgi:hypothetical protein